jgi:hypothetical protein
MKAALMPWMKLIIFGKSYNPNLDPDTRYKTRTQNLRFALTTVPAVEKLPRKAVSLSMKSRKF